MEATIGLDLGVVEQRFPGGRGAEMVGAVRRLLADWDTLMKRMVAAGPEQLSALLPEQATLRDKIEEKLDILVEGAKEEGLDFTEVRL
jgi:hypothetical protein